MNKRRGEEEKKEGKKQVFYKLENKKIAALLRQDFQVSFYRVDFNLC